MQDSTYHRAVVYKSFLKRIFGPGAFVTLIGEAHRIQKQRLLPLFTHVSVKRMADEVHSASDKLVAAIRECVDAHPSPSSSSQGYEDKGGSDRAVTVDVSRFSWAAMLDVIGAVGFDRDFRFGTSPEAKAIHDSSLNIIKLDGTFLGFFAPVFLRAFPSLIHLPLKALEAPGETRAIIHRLGRQIVAERKELEVAGDKRKDLMSTLLRTTAGVELKDVLDNVCVTSSERVSVVYSTSSFADGYFRVSMWPLRGFHLLPGC